MSGLSFSLPDEERDRLVGALDVKQLQQAEYQIVKRTRAALVRILRKDVTDQVNVQSKYLKRVIATPPITGVPPEGRVNVRKSQIPLIAFSPRASKRGGVRVTLTKDKPALALRHAFISTMSNGHRGVFERSRHAPTKGPNIGLAVTRGPTKGLPRYRLGPNGIAQRLAIDELFGPSFFTLVQVPSILQSIQFDAEAELTKQADSQLARFAAGQSINDE